MKEKKNNKLQFLVSIIAIISGLFAILGVRVFDNIVLVNYISSSENTNDKYDEEVLIDVNIEVLIIREKYNSLPNLATLPEPTSKVPVYSYQDTNKMTIIKIINGYKDINYSRIYYFDKNGKLYFAFIFNKRKENRLYFKDDILIRYIDETGIIYDLYDNLDTCEWESLALKESYEIFNNTN